MVQAADEQTALEDEIENLKQQLEDSEKQQATLLEKVWHICKGVAKLALSFSPISSTNFSWNVLILMEDLSRHKPRSSLSLWFPAQCSQICSTVRI